MKTKQIIVMRKFAGLRHGKYCAQAAHASVGALFDLAKSKDINRDSLVIPLDNPAVRDWVNGRFTKVTVYVNTSEELQELYEKAREKGLPCALILDAGLTEFGGIPTLTALGIGPAASEELDPLTINLPLF